jgi:hypothetical protein
MCPAYCSVLTSLISAKGMHSVKQLRAKTWFAVGDGCHGDQDAGFVGAAPGGLPGWVLARSGMVLEPQWEGAGALPYGA